LSIATILSCCAKLSTLLYLSFVVLFHGYISQIFLVQTSKWDFNFGGQLAANSKNLVAKVKKIGSQRYKVKE
jgi:hypothetical protein